MRLTELFGTSTFRLALVYMGVFAGSVLLLLGFLYWSTVAFMSQQLDTTIEAEIVGLAEQYRQRGLTGLARTIRDRVDRNPDGSALYLFTSPSYVPLAGNLSAWPDGVATEDGHLRFQFEDPRDERDMVRARARVFGLQGGFKLLVGRDVRALESTQQLIVRALLWGLAIMTGLALGGGFLMSRTTLRRIEQINETSRDIMAGDLSRRVPTSERGDDFDQLADNLNTMLDEIERLMDGIRRVSDNIAHDLRTPLTRLRTRLETLRHAPPESRHEHLDGCIADADQLLATFGALLRIARIEAGGLRPTRDQVDLAALANDAAELYEALAEAKHVSLGVDVVAPTTIRGDRDLLFQATTNLLDNALKYTPAGGSVVLSVGGHESQAEITVSDNGPGIGEEERDKVTQRFYRVESARSTPGSGLGLSLVDAIARIHHAELVLEDNQPGLRATLRFEVPAPQYQIEK